jgi:hypothetical protein
MVVCGLLLTLALAITWRRDILPRDATGNGL